MPTCWNVYRYPYHGLHEAAPPRELILVLGPTSEERLFFTLKQLLGRGYYEGTVTAEAIELKTKPTATCYTPPGPSGWDGTPGSEVWA